MSARSKSLLLLFIVLLATATVVVLSRSRSGVHQADDEVAQAAGAQRTRARAQSPRRDSSSGSTRQASAVAMHVGKAFVRGRVVTADGQPAGGASVVLETARASPDARVEVAGTTTTAADGAFRFQVPAGAYVALAVRDGLSSNRSETLALAPEGEVADLVLTLEPGATLELTVRDRADGHALKACAARGPGSTAGVCDHAGRIRLGPLAPGPLSLTVSAPGYAPVETTVVLARRARLTAELSLVRGVRVAGRVVDPDRKPVANAHVRASHYVLNGKAPALVSTVSDAAGDFALEGIAPGLVTLLATAEGWAEASSTELRLQGGDERDGLELVLTTGGAVAGRVVDAARNGLPGARVEALRLHDRVVAASDVSTSDGHFRLDGLHPGGYTLTASAGHARAVSQGVTVVARDEVELELVLGADGLTGTVVDASGAAVAGAWVSAVSQLASGLGEVSSTTDKEGRFRFEALEGAPYRVQARAQGRGVAEQRGLAAGADTRLVLAGAGRIEGSVSSEQGQGLESFTVTVTPGKLEPGGSMAGRYRVLKLLSPDGSFTVDELPAGQYELRVDAVEYVMGFLTVEVTADASTRADFRLSKGLVVEGRVLRGEVPVAGCRVMDRVTTGPDGSFRLPGMLPVSIFLWARCGDGEGGGRMVQLTAQSTGLELQVAPAREGSKDHDDFGGIGASLRGMRDGRIVVAGLYEGGPAFLAGVRRNDEIVSVDGWPAHGQAVGVVVERIRGPLGQPVLLELKRPPEGVVFRTVAERSRIVTH